MYNLLKIKVCGLRDPENIEQVCKLDPQMVGYIFYPGSGRYVGSKPDPAIFTIPQDGIKKVGVFVNEEASTVLQIFESYKLDLVQLHGSESVDYCRSLKEEGIPVIKALNPDLPEDTEPGKSKSSREEMGDYAHYARFFLFDTPGKGFGGTGRKFNWKLLHQYSLPVPFLLGGGIGPSDSDSICEMEHDSLLGVDVNSRFEVSPGIKDVALLEEFIKKIRK